VVDERLVLIGSEIQVVLSVRHIHREKPLEKRFESNYDFEGCDFTFACKGCFLPCLILSIFLYLFKYNFTLFQIFLIPFKAW
jgi:hypothetical protein